MRRTDLTQSEIADTTVSGSGQEADAAVLATSGAASDGQPQGTEPRRGRRKQTGFVRQPGSRPLKEYPLTRGDMEALAGIGILATLCFSGAAASAGFWVNVSMSLAMSDKIAPEVKAVWGTYKIIALIAAPILFVFGCALVYLGNSKIKEIMGETSH